MGNLKKGSNVTWKPDTNWENTIGNRTWNELLNRLASGSITADEINQMQDSHYDLYSASGGATPEWNATIQYVDPNVTSYQDKYNNLGLNKIAIEPGYDSRYIRNSKIPTSNDWYGKWQSDGIYGGITDDRRLLGRNDDYSNELIKSKNELLKNYNLELYKDSNGYYKLRPTTNQKQDSTENSQPQNESKWNPTESKTSDIIKIKNAIDSIDFNKLATNIIPFIRLNNTLRKNKKNLLLGLNSIQPVLLLPDRKDRQLKGDSISQNYYNRQANKFYSLGVDSLTADAGINHLMAMISKEKGDESAEKGKLAYDTGIAESKKGVVESADYNYKELIDKANTNIQALVSAAVGKDRLRTEYNTAYHDSWDQFLNELNYKFDQKSKLQQAYNEKLYESQQPSEFTDPTILSLKAAYEADPTNISKQSAYVSAVNKFREKNYRDQLKFIAKNQGLRYREYNNPGFQYTGIGTPSYVSPNDFSYILAKKGGRLVPKGQLGLNVGPLKDSFKTGINGLKDKFKTAFNKENIGGTISTASNVISGMLGPKSEYSGKEGATTQAVDGLYDTVQNALAMVPGGQLAAGVMGANKVLGQFAGKLGAGTDGMTTADGILGSSIFASNLGAINGALGGKSHELVDQTNQIKQLYGDQAMSGFGGTTNAIGKTMQYSNKKYGLVSSGARKKANHAIDKLNSQQSQISDIAATAKNAFEIQSSMSDVNANATAFDLSGGYQQSNVHVGKQGMKFEYDFNIPFKYELEIEKFKKGGQMNVIPEGNLHARLHHMEDADGLTKKGIPVVDNDGNQQAEIELNEIIFNKETTEKLEKLWKEGTDEAAIEAGKLLAKEIIENTDDRTGLINTIK